MLKLFPAARLHERPDFTGPSTDVDRADLIAAVEQSSDAVIVTDSTGKIHYVNPAFTR